MFTGLAPGAALSLTSIGVVAAEAAGGGGVDYAGLAALITAISGLIATVGAIILGLRRSNNNQLDQALTRFLEEQASKNGDGS